MTANQLDADGPPEAAYLFDAALNGFAAYVLAWTVTRRVWPSLVAGAVFIASPYFAAHLHGHFNLTTAWFIPLFAAAVLGALRQRGLLLA